MSSFTRAVIEDRTLVPYEKITLVALAEAGCLQGFQLLGGRELSVMTGISERHLKNIRRGLREKQWLHSRRHKNHINKQEHVLKFPYMMKEYSNQTGLPEGVEVPCIDVDNNADDKVAREVQVLRDQLYLF